VDEIEPDGTGIATGTGGTVETGGSTGNGGTINTGGVTVGATGGLKATGGVTSSRTGGRTPDAGVPLGGIATGGRVGAPTGGTTTPSGGVVGSTCTEAEKTLSGNGSGTHCGLNYEYWKDSGTGSLVLKSGGYSVNWSNINNLLGRKGKRPGSKSNIITYEATYTPNGNSYLCVYGWTRGPLVEYYIVDSWGSWKPPGGSSMGTVSCDGGTYDIYRTQRVNQPSIDGTATFYQFWSVRTAKRTSGTITVGCHFDAWAAKGLAMGNLYEVSMTVEGYQSSGTADVKVSMQ
jgi:endo-1,4-beta-xylanase